MSVTVGELGAMLLLGLFGSVHCLGMCSGLVGCLGSGGSRQVAYQGGRLIAYTLGGAVLAVFGNTARLALHATAGRIVLLAAGLLMLSMGLRMVWGEPAWAHRLGQGLHTLLRAPLRRLLGRRDPGAALGLGLLTGLLPCGLLYVAWLRAAACAHPLSGALLMGAFWLGTAPALLTVAAVLPRLRAQRRGWWRHLPATAVLVLGVLTVSRALSMPAVPQGGGEAPRGCCALPASGTSAVPPTGCCGEAP